MRVDWCVSSWFRIKNTHSHTQRGVWQPTLAVCLVSLFCVCVLLERVVIICPASTRTALVSSPSLTVLHLSVCLPTYVQDKNPAFFPQNKRKMGRRRPAGETPRLCNTPERGCHRRSCA